jgi:hypothetical protein
MFRHTYSDLLRLRDCSMNWTLVVHIVGSKVRRRKVQPKGPNQGSAKRPRCPCSSSHRTFNTFCETWWSCLRVGCSRSRTSKVQCWNVSETVYMNNKECGWKPNKTGHSLRNFVITTMILLSTPSVGDAVLSLTEESHRGRCLLASICGFLLRTNQQKSGPG